MEHEDSLVVHTSLLVIPILSHVNPVRVLKPCLFGIHFNIILLSTSRSLNFSRMSPTSLLPNVNHTNGHIEEHTLSPLNICLYASYKELIKESKLQFCYCTYNVNGAEKASVVLYQKL